MAILRTLITHNLRMTTKRPKSLNTLRLRLQVSQSKSNFRQMVFSARLIVKSTWIRLKMRRVKRSLRTARLTTLISLAPHHMTLNTTRVYIPRQPSLNHSSITPLRSLIWGDVANPLSKLGQSRRRARRRSTLGWKPTEWHSLDSLMISIQKTSIRALAWMKAKSRLNLSSVTNERHSV